jgi:hypothetical protein
VIGSDVTTTFTRPFLSLSADTAPSAGAIYETRMLINGQRYQTSGTVPNPSSTLGFATDLRVTNATATEVTVSWKPPVNSVSYRAFITDDDQFSKNALTSLATTATINEFSSPLQVGKTYSILIDSFNFDRSTNPANFPAQVNTSRVCGKFIFGKSTPDVALTPCPVVVP